MYQKYTLILFSDLFLLPPYNFRANERADKMPKKKFHSHTAPFVASMN